MRPPPPKQRVKRDAMTLARLHEQQMDVVAEQQSKLIALSRSPRNDSAAAKEYAEAIDVLLRKLFELDDRIKGVRPGSAASVDEVAVQIQARLNAIDATVAKP